MSGRLIAVADDLSGAAEAATLLAGVGAGGIVSRRATLTLDVSGLEVDSEVAVFDADLRDISQEHVIARVESLMLDLVRRGELPDFVKIDSLLRGPVAALVGALVRQGRNVAFAPALPIHGRSTIDARVLVGGISLARSGLLKLETAPTDGDVRALLSPLATRVISLDVVRGPILALANAVTESAEARAVTVVDAETDDDLDRLVSVLNGRNEWTLVGSGGAAAALGRVARSAPSQGGSAEAGAPTRRGARVRSILVVVGSGSVAATGQLAALEASGAHIAPLSRDLLLRLGHDASAAEALSTDPVIATAREALRSGVVALTIADRTVRSPESSRYLVAGLGRAAALLAGDSDLVLTGGETARRTLELLGTGVLEVCHVIEHGCVCASSASGRYVVTRPGSFGGPTNFVDAVAHLTSHVSLHTLSRKAEVL